MAAERTNAVKTAEVQIMERYRELYNNMVDDLGKQLSGLKEDNAEMRKENLHRREMTDNMRREIQSLHVEIAELRKELTSMKEEFPCVDCPRRKAVQK